MSGIASNSVLAKKELKSDNVCIHKAFDHLFKDLYVSLVFYTNRMIAGPKDNLSYFPSVLNECFRSDLHSFCRSNDN